jgi:hypothetical protein
MPGKHPFPGLLSVAVAVAVAVAMVTRTLRDRYRYCQKMTLSKNESGSLRKRRPRGTRSCPRKASY